MRGAPLPESVWTLLNDALELYQDSRPATDRLRHHMNRFSEPLRIAVAGPWQSGKSTLVNALIGDEVAPIEAPGGQPVFAWYQDGPEPHAVAYPAGAELPVTRSAQRLHVDSGRWTPAPVNDVVVTWPARTLRNATVIDTPPVPASTDKILRDADAVLYLTRDGRGTDLHALEWLQDGMVAKAAPVNALLVLSRADETGGGRIDALLAARQVARRHQRDPRISGLCLGVVAVGGLAALAGRVLTEADFTALATLAGAPRAELENHLLSTDRFTGMEFPAPVGVEARRALLDRLGIFGVRLATTLIRTGSDTRTKLAAELVRRSGLAELREAVNRCFVDRRDALRARSALAALESVLVAEPRAGSDVLLAELERVLAGAHDFRELRLLASLQGQRVTFEKDLATEARRLIGENGTGLAARLGVDQRATASELWRLGSAALGRWQEHCEDPLLDSDQRRAAEVVVRTCEGLLYSLT